MNFKFTRKKTIACLSALILFVLIISLAVVFWVACSSTIPTCTKDYCPNVMDNSCFNGKMLMIFIGFVFSVLMSFVMYIVWSLIQMKEEEKGHKIDNFIFNNKNEEVKQRLFVRIKSMKSWLKWGIGFSLVPLIFYILLRVFFLRISGSFIYIWLFINLAPLYMTNLVGRQSMFYSSSGFFFSINILGMVLTMMFWFVYGVVFGFIFNKIRYKLA